MSQAVKQHAAPPASAATHTGADALRLHGRRLLAGRLGWLVLAAIVVALDIIALPSTYTVHFTPLELQGLHRANFSPTLYAVITLAENGLGQLSYLAMALLLFWRRSDDRMALFGSLALLSFGGIIAGGFYDPTTGSVLPALAAPPALHVLVSLLFVLAQSSLITFFYLFPSGRFVPRWTRWCAVLLVAYWLAVTVVPTLWSGALGFMIYLFFLTALVAQVYRYRWVSSPVQREQTKWVVAGIVAAALIIVVPQGLVALLVPAAVQNALYHTSVGFSLAASGIWPLALVLIPLSIATAILRSHLWDIDILINRTLVYGSLTATLAAIYFSGVYGGQSILNALVPASPARQSPLLIVASTLIVAALFTPLRRRLQAVVDRRFYRRKYDAARTLAAFGATLRAETDVEQLSRHLLGVVHETMQPAHISLWLRPPQQPPSVMQPHEMHPNVWPDAPSPP